jgi:hypothetical protein
MIFLENAIEVECDVATQYGYSCPQSLAHDSLLQTEVEMQLIF